MSTATLDRNPRSNFVMVMYGVPWESQEVFRVEMGPENWGWIHDCLVLMCFPPIRAIF